MDIAKCILKCAIKCTLRCTPWLHCQVHYQLGVKCIIFVTILCIFKCSLKWNLRCAEVQHREPRQIKLFIESFCALLCPEKCTTMCIFKCNSVFTSSAPLISTSNAPSCVSVYRSQGTTLGVPSDEPSVASPIECVLFVTFLCIFNGSLNWILRCTFKGNINFIMKCTF